MPRPRYSRPRLATVVALTSALAATSAFAQQGERLPRECRGEIVQLCGSDRSQVRSCLRERYSELSENCASQLRERMGNRQGRQSDQQRARPSSAEAAMAVTSTVTYGNHARQQVDVFAPADAPDGAPLVVFIHGGGWSFGSHKRVQAKPAHFTEAGYYFASAGYRVLPDAPVEEQAEDVAAALRALRGQAAAIGYDPERIVLIGHSAGAHLAALVASDPTYAGDDFGAIAGVILLDGAGYDVAAQMAEGRSQARQLYRNAFGTDPARQAALSPITHAGGPDAPHWLALYVGERDSSRAQSEALVDALSASVASSEAVAIPGTDHGRMNRELGTPEGAAQTQAVDAFLAKVFTR